MSILDNAVVVDEATFDSREGQVHEAVIEYRFHAPFQVSKEHKPDHDEDDVVVYGPVYVGDPDMLDRHKELVAPDAIMQSWDTYSKNPVILYNHRKDYGVIGLMEAVEMGDYEKPDGTKLKAVFGRARIDSGEKDITRKIRKGMLRAFSIGFIAKAAVKEGVDDDEAYLRFTKIEWIETSVVDIPASPNALFDISKSLVSYDGAKHVIAVEERDDSYVIEFGKSEMADEPGSPAEEVERSYEEEVMDLLDAVEDLQAKLDMMNATIGTVKTHVAEPNGMTETEHTEVMEESLDEEFVDVPTEEVVEIKHEGGDETVLEEEESEEAEEVAEESEEAEEVPEEELSEEGEAKEVGEVDILTEVVSALMSVETGLKNLVERLDETESLKAMVAERDETIASLTSEKEVAEAEAAIEAEVGKRMAALAAAVGIPKEAALAASPKSLSPVNTETKTKSVTDHDPLPEVSEGMAGLGSWLEARLVGRGVE